MQAIRQIVRIPRNHEVKIKIPGHIAEDELMEVILLVKERDRTFIDKIEKLKQAAKDPLFLKDMEEVNRDFSDADFIGQL